MKDHYKALLLGGGGFGCCMGLFATILTFNLMDGLLVALVCGAIFGLLLSLFVYIQTNNFKKHRSEIVDENNLIFDGGANHFKGSESVGGWLYLTQNELIFKSHNFNIQNHKEVIPLNQITGIRAPKNLGFIPNGVTITANGIDERYVVFKRKEWIHKINEAIATKK